MSTPADQLDLSNFPQPQLLGQGAPTPPGAYPGLSQYFQAPLQLPTAPAPTAQQGPPVMGDNPLEARAGPAAAAYARDIPMTGAPGGAPSQPGMPAPTDPIMQPATTVPGQGGYGLTPAETQGREASFTGMTAATQAFTQTAQEVANKYPAYAAKVGALMAERDKALGLLNADISKYDEQLANYQLEAAGKARDMDAALTQWATQTPTRQATYAASMHIAPMLSIMAAIGGAITKTNAIGLLQATTGVVAGVNSGNEVRYQAALDEWNTRYRALHDHQTRLMDVYKQYQDAYMGMADAKERAAARTRLATGDQIETAQLKMMPSLGLLEAQEKVMNGFSTQVKAWAAIEAARNRSLMYGLEFPVGGGATGLDQPLSQYDPYEIAIAASDWQVPIPGGMRNVGPLAAGASRLNPNITLRQWLQDRRNNLIGVRGDIAGATTIQRTIARQQPTLITLIRPNGILDQVDNAAKRLADTGMTDSQLENEIRGAWGRYTENSSVAPNDIIGAYVTKMKALQGLEASILSRTGQATDMTRGMAADEFKLWSPYPYLHSQLQAAKDVDIAVYGGDVDALEERQSGTSYHDINQRIQQMGQQPVGGAQPATGATTQQQVTPGIRSQTDIQGRVLRHSRSQGDVYVNPNDPSDWVKAPSANAAQ